MELGKLAKGLSTLFGSITSGTNAIRLPYIILSAQTAEQCGNLNFKHYSLAFFYTW